MDQEGQKAQKHYVQFRNLEAALSVYVVASSPEAALKKAVRLLERAAGAEFKAPGGTLVFYGVAEDITGPTMVENTVTGEKSRFDE